MAFLFRKWRFLEDQKLIRERHGENSALIIRSMQPISKGSQRIVPHSFPHLIGKRFTVPVYTYRPFFSTEVVSNPYAITKAERDQAIRNRASK